MTNHDHTITGRAFRQFQYPTVPLAVSDDFKDRILYSSLGISWNEPSNTGTSR